MIPLQKNGILYLVFNYYLNVLKLFTIINFKFLAIKKELLYHLNEGNFMIQGKRDGS